MKKLNLALLVLILCLSLGSASLNAWGQENEAAAIINGVEISKAAVIELLIERFGAATVQEIIQRELVKQKADEHEVEISDEQVSEFLIQFVSQIGGPQALDMLLMQNNITDEQFVDQIYWNLMVLELSKKEVETNEEIVTAWFEENRHYYDLPETVEVSHILVETEAEANEILESITAGADFDELARQESIDPGTAPLGGYLGPIAEGDTVAEFNDTAFALEAGEYGIVESGYGWHIILAHARHGAEIAVLDNIYDIVEDDYKRENCPDARAYLLMLETEAEVEIFFP